MKRQTRMAKKRTTRKPASRRTPSARKKPEAKNLRQTLYSLALWALGTINVVFIASFIMKYIPTDGEQSINALEQTSLQTAPVALKLEVLNGCGTPGIGKKFADHLEKNGFTPANVDNFDNFDMPNTIIIDRKSAHKLNGLRVAESLGLPASTVIYQEKDVQDVDVTVVIGKDYPKVDFLRE
ncbi:MAG: LytR C-terminal domain-containing protein [bacterium]